MASTLGIVTAFGCVVATITAIKYVMNPRLSSLYVSVSWLMVGLSICTLAGMAVVGGWGAAIGFTATYILLSVIPPLIALSLLKVSLRLLYSEQSHTEFNEIKTIRIVNILTGFHFGVDTLSALGCGSITLIVELGIIIALKSLFILARKHIN